MNLDVVEQPVLERAKSMSRNPHSSHELAIREVDTSNGCLRARGPLALPGHVCARCGSTEQGGTMRTEVITYVNPWIWLTAFISWIITWIVYVATRKRMEVQYYLCPECADRRKIWTLTTGSVTFISIVGIFVVVALGDMTLLSSFIASLTAGALGFVIAARPALRATGHDDGVFSLSGAAPELLNTVKRKQLTDG